MGVWAPVSVTTADGAQVNVDTDYPFGDTATVTVTPAPARAVPVLLRIPGWAVAATVNGEATVNGTMWRGAAPAGRRTAFHVDFAPSVRVERWFNDAVSVHRGALMYSLPIAANYTTYAHHFGARDMSSDYYLSPTSPWAYALDLDLQDPGQSLAFVRVGAPGAAPFNHTGWPVMIRARARPLAGWGVAENSAAPVPASPACTPNASACGAPRDVFLVPHGGTDLRIGELPLSGFP